MTDLGAPKLGKSVQRSAIEPGHYYAVEAGGGFLIGFAGAVDDEPVFVILGKCDSFSSDNPPVWVLISAIPSEIYYELEDTVLLPAHTTGEGKLPAGELEAAPRHGDLIEDDTRRQFLFLAHKRDRRAFLIGDGRAWPEFDPVVVFRRWRLMQGGSLLCAFESPK